MTTDIDFSKLSLRDALDLAILVEEEAAYIPIYYYSGVNLNKPWLTRTYQKLGGQHWDKWTIDWEAKKAATE